MSHINALQINLSAVGREGQLITSKQAASNQSEITDRLERIIKTMYWSSRGTISGEEGGVRNRKKGENKRGKDDAVERRARRELKRVGEK